MSFQDKIYGRNEEIASLFRMFESGRDISMHGPRRLGKTFLLDRLVDAAASQNWTAVKAELAGCADTRAVFREMCARIGSQRSGGAKAVDWFTQRFSQLLGHRSELGGSWYQGLLSVDYESHFERLIKAMNDDPHRRWLLLIDELPIFLKVLHDRGPGGPADARNFMNLLSRLRQQNPKVRWMITGSIGIEPLARVGDYLGVLAKFQPYELHPLSEVEARAYLQDLASEGQLPHRNKLTDAEADGLIAAVGWLVPYYLDALAQKVKGEPTDLPDQAQLIIEEAVDQLLQPNEMTTFGPWEEHLRKHYVDSNRELAFGVMGVLAEAPHGANLDVLLTSLRRPELQRSHLHALLIRLHTEGFITVNNGDHDSPQCNFRNPLLRRWWLRYMPQAAV